MSEEELTAIRGRRIGLVFQEPQNCLSPVWDIETQFRDVLRTHFGLRRDEARDKTVILLNEVGLRNVEKRLSDFPHRFSGGELQRILIALVLAAEPELLILDEPTTALDVGSQADLLEMLSALCRSRSITSIVISHDFSTIAHLASKVLVMNQGKVIESGPLERVLHNPVQPYTRKLLASIPGKLKSIVS